MVPLSLNAPIWCNLALMWIDFIDNAHSQACLYVLLFGTVIPVIFCFVVGLSVFFTHCNMQNPFEIKIPYIILHHRIWAFFRSLLLQLLLLTWVILDSNCKRMCELFTVYWSLFPSSLPFPLQMRQNNRLTNQLHLSNHCIHQLKCERCLGKKQVFPQLIMDGLFVINTNYYLNNIEKRKQGQFLGHEYQSSANAFKEVKWPDNMPEPSSGKIIKRRKNSCIALRFNRAEGFLKKKCWGVCGKNIKRQQCDYVICVS